MLNYLLLWHGGLFKKKKKTFVTFKEHLNKVSKYKSHQIEAQTLKIIFSTKTIETLFYSAFKGNTVTRHFSKSND